jgi:hypothetical protein
MNLPFFDQEKATATVLLVTANQLNKPIGQAMV